MDQALPTAFENNANTWQNMPGMAAFYTGQQNQIAQDNIAALQQAFAAEQAFKAQERPISLNNMMKSGALQEAQAQHALALARASGLASDKAEKVMPGEVSSTNAKNAAETAAAEQAQSNARAIHMASWLQGPGKAVPSFMQAKKFMEVYGIEDSPDGAIGRKIVADLPRIIPMLEMEAKKAYELSATGQGTLIKEAGDTKRMGMANKTAIDVANINADSRINAAAKTAQAKTVGFEDSLLKIKRASDKRNALIDAANREQANNPELAASYRARANDPDLIQTAQAELAAAAAATVTQGPNGPVLGTRQEGVQLGGNAPAKPTQEHSLADVQKMYPGVPPEKLRQAYKEKFGVDLK